MTVGEMIAKLQQFDPNLELLITDGHDAQCYRGSYAVDLFLDCDGYAFCDIGIGGCKED